MAENQGNTGTTFKTFDLDEIREAFDRISNPADWKAPISAQIKVKEKEVIAVAIEFYTATKAHFTKAGPNLLNVTAKGYRLGPAGDH